MAVLAGIFLSVRHWEHGDWRNPVTGQRHCRTPEDAVVEWANSYSQRRPAERRRSELDRLESWAAEHPQDLNRPWPPARGTRTW